MKRIITILAIFMTMICGSVFFVSCSNSYKKMQLVVEYALPTEDNKDVEWVRVDKGTNFDYILSSGVYSEADMAHVLYLRISVKGTSKKVSSLHISRSESTSVTLESQTVKPGEAFKVLVHNIGSVRFTATPSHGGEDKAVTFGVNVYKELTGISQRSTCVPAVVVGGNIFLDNLTKLVKYEPMGETNQTGVNFALAGVGTLANDGTDNLLGRDFVADENYTLLEDGIKHINRGEDDECDVNLTHNNGLLSLNVSTKYVLTPHNNVIHLVATSKYHEDITTDIYVYIVENFKDALLISYDKNVELDNEGKIPTNPDDAKPIDNEIIIYNSIVDSNLVGQKFNVMDMYVYTNKSIYSFASKPGMKLNVFVNGTKYNYEDVVNDDFGIQISSIYDLEDDLLGLKFAVNPNSESKLKTYNIRIEVDFIAFDFSASDTAPVLNLTKEFKINVETLASGFNVNGRGYLDNSAEAIKGNYATITEMNKDNTSSNKVAELYTTYSLEKIGLPLNIQPTPPNAINSKVYVGFYNTCYEDNNGKLALGTNLFTDGKLQLLNSINDAVSNTDGLFEIDFSNKNRRVYLRFNDGVVIDDIKEVFMVCKVACTPEKFGLDSEIDKKYITFVARIDVVGAVDQIYIQKTDNDGNEHTLTDKYLPTNTIKTAYINFKSISNAVDYSQITISSGKGHIQFSHNGIDWDNKITADKLGNAKIKTLYFKVNQPCVDSLEIESPNGKSAKLEYEFVNVVNNISTIKVDYDSPYIENIGKDNLTSEQVVKYDGKTTSLEYLALQSGRLVQFKVSGDGKNSTIASIDAYTLLPSDEEYMGITKDDKPLYQTAISKFSASAVRIPTIGQYFFDVNANSVGFTSIVFVTVQYYAEVDRKVELQTKYFVYEVAVYNPAKNLTVIADKESIIYINDNYSEVSDVSIVNFDILVNSATRSILFSNAELNQKINGSYGFEGTSCIYGFVVSPSPSVFPSGTDGQEYFKLDSDNLAEKVKDTECYVNNATRRFWVKAVKDLKPLQDKGISYIYFDVAIYQFGKKVETSEVRQVVYLGNYNKADDVAIVSGVDTYYNTYLSLLNGDDSVEIEAYATNENDDVTYLELGREIYRQGETNEYNGPNLTVEYDNVNNIFTINATGEGGVYNIIFFTKDSEKSENRIEKSITVTVSDGASEETAYFITSAQEFAKLKGKTPSGEDVTKGKYYRLRHDVNISALGEYGWWEESRNFAGHLSGSMTITDPNSGEVVYKSYALTELTISRQFQIGTDICYGLFNTVSGTIKDVVFRDVVINVELGETASTSIINIGAITAINSGNINNCSVNIKSSAIQFGKTTEIVESNIGLIAGLNAGSIIHTTSNIGSNYSHLADVEDGGKLLVTIPIANKLDGNSVNIGAVVGQNTGLIQSDYSDDSSKSINSIISVVANIKVVVEYDNQNAPNQIDLNVGGVAGYNNTKDIEKGIKNIAITGSIIVGDKANIGAIVGKNAGTISEVANYGAHIEGVVYKDNYATTVGDTPETLTYHSYNNEENVINQEQNIGGIIGFNDSVAVDNVRVLFIHFESDKIKIAPNSAVISGVGNVGGIIGKSKHTTLTRAYVENFVENTGATINYNIIGKTVKVNNVDVGANVAGLIASSEDENNVLLSFVQADFDVTGCDFYEFGKGLTSYQYAYFKGDIKVEESKISEEQNAQNAINNTTYIIKNIVKADGSKIVKEFGLDDIVGDSNEEYVNGIYISDEYTANGNGYQFTIVWARDTKYEINEEKPYLMYRLNGQELLHTLTIRPTEVGFRKPRSVFV